MVKFSIARGDNGKLIVTNMETGATYSTGQCSMQRLWDHVSPNFNYMESDMFKTEGIYVADLDPEFEVGVKNNLSGGYRHRKRSHKKRSHKKRSHKKRTTRRR